MTNKEAIKKIQSTVCTDESGCVCRHFPACLYAEDVCEFKLAIQALEKQTPKKPKNIKLKDKIMTTNYECPICGCRRLGHGIDLSKCYCPECGQKIDWEGA